jgi:hypothetical protein
MKNQLPQDPIPVRTEPVRIYVTHEVAFNLEKMQQITRKALGRLGCEGCHSGRLLEFIQIQDFVVNPKTLELDEVVGPLGR